jgi:hypothetical protein
MNVGVLAVATALSGSAAGLGLGTGPLRCSLHHPAPLHRTGPARSGLLLLGVGPGPHRRPRGRAALADGSPHGPGPAGDVRRRPPPGPPGLPPPDRDPGPGHQQRTRTLRPAGGSPQRQGPLRHHPGTGPGQRQDHRGCPQYAYSPATRSSDSQPADHPPRNPAPAGPVPRRNPCQPPQPDAEPASACSPCPPRQVPHEPPPEQIVRNFATYPPSDSKSSTPKPRCRPGWTGSTWFPRLARQILGTFSTEARVLEMDGSRTFAYDSVYFDTPTWTATCWPPMAGAAATRSAPGPTWTAP